MKTHHKIFLLLTAVIALSDVLFIFINYRSSQATMNEHLKNTNRWLHSTFAFAFASTQTRMLEIAAFVANDPRIQQVFLKGAMPLSLKEEVEEDHGLPRPDRNYMI